MASIAGESYMASHVAAIWATKGELAPPSVPLLLPLPAAYAIPAVAANRATTTAPAKIRLFLIVQLLLHRDRMGGV